MNFRLTLLWSAVLVAMPLTLLGTSPMGLVNVSVACMREEPRHGAELVSQALMGTPVRLLEPAQGGEWWRVQSPDGYEAYMIGNSLVVCDSARYAVWKSSPRLVVTALAQTAVTEGAAGGVVSDLVNGCVLEGSMSPADSVCRVTLPDGRTGMVSVADVMPIEQWACQPYDAEAILRMGQSMMGTPYMWGGMSAKSLDCSGFVRVCFWANGRMLPRDASPQSHSGMEILVEDLRRGDLLFFGSRVTGRINHVAISKGGAGFIHCSGRVMNGSLDPASADYSHLHFVKAVRPLHGGFGSQSVVRVGEHPWYFNVCPVK